MNSNWELLEDVMESVNDLVVNGQLTPSQYANLLKELNGLISKGDITINDFSPEVLEKLNEANPDFTLLSVPRNGSVTPIKTTFFNIGGNLFDGNYEHGLLMTQQNNTVLMTRGNYSGVDGRTAVIQVEPNTTYMIELDITESNVIRVGTHSSRLEFPNEASSAYYLDNMHHSTSPGESLSSLEVRTNNTANFMYIYVSNEGKEPSLTLNKKNDRTTIKNEYIDLENLLDKNITPGHTTFFSKGGNNLFTGHYEDALLVLRDDGTTLEPRYNYGSWNGKTAVIPIEPNTEYTVEADPSQSNVFRVGTHTTSDAFMIPDSSNRLNNLIIATSVDEGPRSVNFTSNSTDRYLYVYVSNEGVNVDLTVKTGVAKLLEYRDGLLAGMDTSGKLKPTLNYNEWEGKTAIFKVKPKTTYQIDVNSDQSNVVRIGGHRSLVDFREYPSTLLLDTTHYDSSAGNSEYTHEITTASADEYLYVYVSNEGVEADVTIRNDSYVIPSHFLDLSSLPQPPSDADIKKDYRFNFNGDFNSVYSHPEIPDFISNPTTFTPAEYHSMFKDLVDEYPDILKRTKLGDDNYNNEMFKYELKPWEYYRQESEGLDSPDHEKMENPKIVITAGVHGREKSASYVIYYFVREMLKNLEDNENLDGLLTNIHFVFIPMACPSGFIDDSYGNRSGQNLNRDFPPYGKLSQPESQYIKNVLDDNSDMDYFIDFHNLLYKSDHIGYALTDDEFFSRAAMNAYKSVGRSWQKRYSGMPQEITHRWAYSTRANVGTVGKYVQDILGVPATIIEAPRQNNFFGDNSLHSVYCTRIGIDILVNTLNACVRNEM